VGGIFPCKEAAGEENGMISFKKRKQKNELRQDQKKE